MSQMFTIEKDNNWEKLRVALTTNFSHNVRRQINANLIQGANNIRNRIILSMQNTPRTGRINKRFKKGRGGKRKGIRYWKSGSVIRRSSPGNPPAPDYGDLIGRIIVDVKLRPTEIEVGAGKTSAKGKPLKYAKYLEWGTKTMKARPFLEPAANHEIPLIEKRITESIKNKSIPDSLK